MQMILCGLLMALAGDDFVLRPEPVFLLVAGGASPFLVYLIRSFADFRFQISWGTVRGRGFPNERDGTGFGHGDDLVVGCLGGAGSLCFCHSDTPLGTAKSMNL